MAIDGGPSLFPRTLVSQANPTKLDDLQETNEVDVATSMQENNNRERRPGLGRKRARFSLKPNSSSQPAVNLEPTLDVSKLKDPEEFFSAFEKLENAKEELQRQTGSVLTDIDEDKLFTVAPRPRRAGISGRTVKYKHRYAASLSPQDTFEENGSGPRDRSSKEETCNANLQPKEMDMSEEEIIDADLQAEERDLASSITRTEKKVNELLDELLAGSCEELDGDKAMNVLRERLQIKPINLDNLSLPEFGDVHKMDLKASRPIPQRSTNSFPDIHNILKGVPTNKSPSKTKNLENSASPSPLASISLLQKRLSKSNPLIDPFSAHDIDFSPEKFVSPTKSINQQSGQVVIEKSAFGELSSSMIKDNNPSVANISASGSHADIEENTEFNGMDIRISDEDEDNTKDFGMDDMVVNEDNKSEDADVDDRIVNEDHDVQADVHQAIPVASQDRVMDECSNNQSIPAASQDRVMDECSNNQLIPAASQDRVMDECSNNQSIPAASQDRVMDECSSNNQSIPAASQDRVMDEFSNIVDSVLQHYNQEVQESTVVPQKKQRKEIPRPSKERKKKELFVMIQEVQESTVVPQKKQRKEIPRPSKEHKKKEQPRRQSLAASGTSWENGARRSTRIKSRPLEYWKGERFLYGRIHQSLPTVIGIKYESPTNKDAKSMFKVKSYVPEDYKELVDLAALH
ncbi:hypothetical protein ACFE04_031768 [Oxalis oulophora]